MNAKEFAKIKARDFDGCAHCGIDDDTLVPQHRANRGHGGVKSRNRLSNIVTLCSAFNGLVEADADAAQEARMRGWKLESWQDPLFEPVWITSQNKWFLLDDDGGSVELLDWEDR